MHIFIIAALTVVFAGCTHGNKVAKHESARSVAAADTSSLIGNTIGLNEIWCRVLLERQPVNIPRSGGEVFITPRNASAPYYIDFYKHDTESEDYQPSIEMVSQAAKDYATEEKGTFVGCNINSFYKYKD